MKIDTTKTWVKAKDLKMHLTNEMHKMKRKGKNPIVVGKRVEGKNGNIKFVPTEIIDAEKWKKRPKKSTKRKQNKKKEN